MDCGDCSPGHTEEGMENFNALKTSVVELLAAQEVSGTEIMSCQEIECIVSTARYLINTQH